MLKSCFLCLKVANKTEPFFGVVLEYVNCTTKISQQFYGVTSEPK